MSFLPVMLKGSLDATHPDRCQLPHVALVLSGALHVVMDDGSEEDFRKNDVMLLPPRARRLDNWRGTLRFCRVFSR
jgi:hypothetical protein